MLKMDLRWPVQRAANAVKALRNRSLLGGKPPIGANRFGPLTAPLFVQS
jgi:hypothetical protein